jgi:serine/threonine protein kinase
MNVLEGSLQDITIFERIGGGQFGHVFRGRWQGTTEVALKSVTDTESFEFAREVSMLAYVKRLDRIIDLCRKLNHPNIIRFFGVHLDQSGKLYMVMEYMHEGSLLDKIRSLNEGLSVLDKLSVLVFPHLPCLTAPDLYRLLLA